MHWLVVATINLSATDRVFQPTNLMMTSSSVPANCWLSAPHFFSLVRHKTYEAHTRGGSHRAVRPGGRFDLRSRLEVLRERRTDGCHILISVVPRLSVTGSVCTGVFLIGNDKVRASCSSCHGRVEVMEPISGFRVSVPQFLLDITDSIYRCYRQGTKNRHSNTTRYRS